MKKVLGYIIIIISIVFTTNVFACGELKSIKVENASIKSNGNLDYIISLNNSVDNVYLDVTSDYDFVEGYGPREVSTNEKAIIKVDGNNCGYGIYTYTFEFRKLNNIIADNTDPVSYNVSLENLAVDNYDIKFNPSTYEYNLTVDESTTFISISTTKKEDTDTVVISGNSLALEPGLNKVTITVTNKDSESGIYTLNVTRSEKASDNNYLASLKVDGYTLNFERDITDYILNVKSSDSLLNISYVTEDKNAKVIEENNNNIKNGTVVTLKVTAQDGTVRNYNIKVKKSFDIMEYKLYIIVGGLVLLLILLILFTRKGKKKPKKEKVEPETISAPETTAGELSVPEVTTPVEEVKTETVTEGNATLEIITPTDVESPVPETTYEETAHTEVFKL